jgi:hypothetical protein
VSPGDTTWLAPEPGWVCPECGFDFDACTPRDAPPIVRSFPDRFHALLTRGLPGEDLDALLRARPLAGTWSALEYACHSRDAFALYTWRIGLVIAEDHPSFSRANRDAMAVELDYNGQAPAAVLDELTANADGLASRLETVQPEEWARTGLRDGEELSVDWMARNAVHEGRHHLLDIGRVLRAARHRGP